MRLTSTSGTISVASPDARTRALRIFLLSALGGILLAVFWSFYLVDTIIGGTIANTAFGADAKALDIASGGPLLGIAFSFVAGIASSFCACTISTFSCGVSLAGAKPSEPLSLWRSLGLMALGVIAVTSIYGALGALFGTAIPALDATTKLPIGAGLPVRLLQSTVVFVVIGAVLVLYGLVTLGLVKNPFQGLAADRPWLKPVALGLLVGSFVVGRPYPLFFKSFQYASQTHNALYGALAISLHGLGNIVIMALVLVALKYGTGGRFDRWLQSNPGRIIALSAAAMIIGGMFYITYWGVRVPNLVAQIGWFPRMPYQ